MSVGRRDDFSELTKRALALRAGYRCSFEGCRALTAGPSEESPSAVTNIGEAAHICAAAPGGRRYLAEMTSAERSSIANGIWLCVLHSRLIDRDEVTFTAEKLLSMKRDHESLISHEVSSGNSTFGDLDFIALGPGVLAVGRLLGTTGLIWRLHVRHFLIGDLAALISFGEEFEGAALELRYVLLNALGEGRSLASPPQLETVAGGFNISCEVLRPHPRIPAHSLPTDLAMGDSADLYLSGNDLATVSGLNALPQRISLALSIQRGERWFQPEEGSRIGDYMRLLRTSSWLPRLLKLETIRMACIPSVDRLQRPSQTSLLCVRRVFAVEQIGGHLRPDWGQFVFDLDVEGVGRWTAEISVYIPKDPH